MTEQKIFACVSLIALATGMCGVQFTAASWSWPAIRPGRRKR